MKVRHPKPGKYSLSYLKGWYSLGLKGGHVEAKELALKFQAKHGVKA